MECRHITYWNADVQLLGVKWMQTGWSEVHTRWNKAQFRIKISQVGSEVGINFIGVGMKPGQVGGMKSSKMEWVMLE